MLFAIAGSQGSGKTTVLNHLKDEVHIIERKTSRSILSDWGVTLEEVNNDLDLSVKFQQEITKRKVEDEQHAINSDKVWFTERTHLDLLTFATVNLGKNNEYAEWFKEYANECLYHHRSYAGVFYLKAGHFSIEEDGIRGVNPLYSRMIDLTMQDMMEHFTLPSRLFIIDTPLLDQRVQTIKNFTYQLAYERTR